VADKKPAGRERDEVESIFYGNYKIIQMRS
jgi:hypothetical protein